MSPEPWLTGHIIQAQYLNSLQELVSDWSDNVLLAATGPSVYVAGATSAPAEVVVDGYMRVNEVTDVATVIGPAGSYNVYATTRRGVPTFNVELATSMVVAQHSRLLGTLVFDGVNVTDVTSALREINVSHLDGYQPYEMSTPQGIPAGRADASLDPNWLANLEDGLIPVGGVREFWVPSSAAPVAAPTGWRFLDGSTVPQASHAFPGIAVLQLPDLRNRHSFGANPYNVYGSSGGVGVVPGVNGVGGNNTNSDIRHDHSGGLTHTHDLNTHNHSASHDHSFVRHAHTHAVMSRHLADNTPPHTDDATSALAWGNTSYFGGTSEGTMGGSMGAETPPTATYMKTNVATLTTGNNALVTTGGAHTGGAVGANTTAGHNAMNITPWHRGLAYIMRVM